MALIKSPLITIGRNPHRLVNRGLSNKVINALQLAMVTSHSISVVGTVGKARLSWGMIPVITVVMPVTVERLRITDGCGQPWLHGLRLQPVFDPL